ncbi:DUF6175 family protein [Spirochaeta africana]|nr:DUF6175 family protein [Spirochaeta africana]
MTVLILLILLVSSCATEAPRTAAPVDRDTIVVGRGEGDTLGQAMNSAKVDAIRQGVIAIIGEPAEVVHREELQMQLYNTRNPNAYVVNERMEILHRDNLGSIREPRYVMEIEIPVRLDVIRRTLDSLGITEVDDPEVAVTPGTPAAPAAPRLPEQIAEEDLYDGATSEQARFLQRYIQNMTYMVFYPEESDTDPVFLRQAVAQANSFLASEGYTLIDASQIERLRQDQEMIFEAEAQRDVSLVQWIAQRLNADVYLEVDVDVEGETQGDSHFGTANIIIRIYETSTAQLLGSVPFRSQRTFSRTGQRDAIGNAVQSAVFGAMPTAVQQAQNLLAQAYSRGIRYEMVLINTGDPRVISRMRTRLRDEVSDLVTISQTADETRYAVYFFGRIDELEDLMYDLSDRVAGMENLFLVMTRGKTITFDLGL